MRVYKILILRVVVNRGRSCTEYIIEKAACAQFLLRFKPVFFIKKITTKMSWYFCRPSVSQPVQIK
jgi:hypothetical protein